MWIYFHSSPHWYSVMPSPFVEYAFSIIYFLGLWQNSVVVGEWIDIQFLESAPLVLLSVFVPISGSFQYYSSVVDWSEGMWCLQKLFFCIRLFWLFCILFAFLYEVEYFYFEVCEEFFWCLHKNGIEPVDCFWKGFHFCYLDFYLTSARDIFPFSNVFFSCFLPRFNVHFLQSFHFN